MSDNIEINEKFVILFSSVLETIKRTLDEFNPQTEDLETVDITEPAADFSDDFVQSLYVSILKILETENKEDEEIVDLCKKLEEIASGKEKD